VMLAGCANKRSADGLRTLRPHGYHCPFTSFHQNDRFTGSWMAKGVGPSLVEGVEPHGEYECYV